MSTAGTVGAINAAATAAAQRRADIRARLRAQIDSEARGKVETDEVLYMVQHGVHKHQREQRQLKVKLRQQRLENAFDRKVRR